MDGDLAWGGEHAMQYIDDVLQNSALEIYVILLTIVTPINSIKNLSNNLKFFTFILSF